jgi:hypothetical protein
MCKILLIAHLLFFCGLAPSILMMAGNYLKNGDLKDVKILSGLKLI